MLFIRTVVGFVLLMTIWIALTGDLSPVSIAMGAVGAVLSAIAFGDISHRESDIQIGDLPRKVAAFVRLVFLFFYEAISSAVMVARHALSRNMSLQPGIVKIYTDLTDGTAIAVLANLITLTPGTLTMDYDVKERCLYVHRIDMQSEEEKQQTDRSIRRFERCVRKVFE